MIGGVMYFLELHKKPTIFTAYLAINCIYKFKAWWELESWVLIQDKEPHREYNRSLWLEKIQGLFEDGETLLA